MDIKDDDDLLPKIDINEIHLYEAMNNIIASLMYATKLIESLRAENAELKARLNYIQNSSSEMFIPPENSQNRGED